MHPHLLHTGFRNWLIGLLFLWGLYGSLCAQTHIEPEWGEHLPQTEWVHFPDDLSSPNEYKGDVIYSSATPETRLISYNDNGFSRDFALAVEYEEQWLGLAPFLRDGNQTLVKPQRIEVNGTGSPELVLWWIQCKEPSDWTIYFW